MGFSPEQIASLSSALTRSHVKTRDQGGRKVSYIEGWHVIAEANRIFGFDGWSRETIELKCVSEKAREIGQRKDPGHGVTYIARVRIRIQGGALIREGAGAGHGIDRDLGQAHESALKEAETDAMKRALMTFGNPFGLALYDKEQANVADEPDLKTAFIADRTTRIGAFTDYDALGTWWNSEAEKTARKNAGLDASDIHKLKEVVMTRRENLQRGKAA